MRATARPFLSNWAVSSSGCWWLLRWMSVSTKAAALSWPLLWPYRLPGQRRTAWKKSQDTGPMPVPSLTGIHPGLPWASAWGKSLASFWLPTVPFFKNAHLTQPGMKVNSCDPSTGRDKSGGLWFWNQPTLHITCYLKRKSQMNTSILKLSSITDVCCVCTESLSISPGSPVWWI